MSRTAIIAAGITLVAVGCASIPGGDDPEVRLSAQGPEYISPAVSPGDQDFFPVGVDADFADEAVPVSYTVTVVDGEGTTVYGAEVDESPAVPERTTWNGRDDRNNFVEDGAYALVMTVTDSHGRTATSNALPVEVNNTPPEADVDVAYRVFSPDGEGERDALPFRQYGRDADEWTGRITDADGNDVVVWNWSDELPEDHRWDGTDVAGKIVDDGRYRYTLVGTDRAGNRASVAVEDLRVDTERPGISLQRNRAAFSPDDDGVQDTVTLTPDVPSDAELLEWTFSISDADGTTVMERSGEADVSREFTFSGRDGDEMLPEGEYVPSLAVTFRNGESDTVEGRPVELDVTPPSVKVEAERDRFSPEAGDGEQSISLRHETEDAATLAGAIVPAGKDDPILTRTWDDGETPESFSWNGQTSRGDTASTGRYRYELTATDRAGNRAVAESDTFLLDRDAPSIRVDVTPTPFHPGADDAASLLEISIDTEDRSDIADGRVTIYDPEGNVFVRLDDGFDGDDPITWDGRGSDGELPESARDYVVSVTVADSLGNEGTTEATIPIGILVEEDQGGDQRFRITGIHFPPFEADFTDLNDADLVEENRETLDEIAELLKEYPDQNVRVEGHAVHIYHDEERSAREQEEVLLPLSQDRAEVIVEALVDRGVEEDRLSAVGRGGMEPLVPHEDREERWKNRRVEFELAD